MNNRITPQPELVRLEQYLLTLAKAVSHKDRLEPLVAYCAGLLLPGERKSVEPMAAMIDPHQVSRRHQSLHHFVSQATWSDDTFLEAAYDYAITPMLQHGPITHWIIDDTSIPKKGRHSVGVARQYCAPKGKTDNCQVAVTLTIGNGDHHLPVGFRLYLPESWTEDPERMKKTGVPEHVRFQKKWEIALGLIDQALASGKPQAPVLTDAGYGDSAAFRQGLTERRLPYVVGIKKHTLVQLVGHTVSAENLAMALLNEDYRLVDWRIGSQGTMQGRFAMMRVRPNAGSREETLLIEWPQSEKEPTKYWLSTLPPGTSLETLVRLAKERWQIERDYQELKDELGLDHYEGRNWRGFHHHASLCIAAYAFLVAERATFSPLYPSRFRLRLEKPPVPEGFRPRGAGTGRAASAPVDREPA